MDYLSAFLFVCVYILFAFIIFVYVHDSTYFGECVDGTVQDVFVVSSDEVYVKVSVHKDEIVAQTDPPMGAMALKFGDDVTVCKTIVGLSRIKQAYDSIWKGGAN